MAEVSGPALCGRCGNKWPHGCTCTAAEIMDGLVTALRQRVAAWVDWATRWVAARKAREDWTPIIGHKPPTFLLEDARRLNDQLDALLAEPTNAQAIREIAALRAEHEAAAAYLAQRDAWDARSAQAWANAVAAVEAIRGEKP